MKTVGFLKYTNNVIIIVLNNIFLKLKTYVGTYYLHFQNDYLMSRGNKLDVDNPFK